MYGEGPNSAISAESVDSRPRTIRSLDRRSFHSPKSNTPSLIEYSDL